MRAKNSSCASNGPLIFGSLFPSGFFFGWVGLGYGGGVTRGAAYPPLSVAKQMTDHGSLGGLYLKMTHCPFFAAFLGHIVLADGDARLLCS